MKQAQLTRPDTERGRMKNSYSRMPILGKIRLGIKVKTAEGKPYPKDVPYFVFDENIREHFPKFIELYGEQPTVINGAWLPPLSPEIIASEKLAEWNGKGKCVCSGNGEVAQEWGFEGFTEVPCPCDKLDKGVCKYTGRLLLMFPEISPGGLFEIETHSFSNGKTLMGSIDFIESMCAMWGGTVGGRPVRIWRAAKNIPFVNAKGEDQKSTHWPVMMEAVNYRQTGAPQLDAPAERLALPAAEPRDVTDSDPATAPNRREVMLKTIEGMATISDLKDWMQANMAELGALKGDDYDAVKACCSRRLAALKTSTLA